MHYDQFKDLGLEDTMRGLAAAMAEALAVMHWECPVDANDVEYVLGSAPTIRDMPHTFSKGYNFESREVHFWLLDFSPVKGFDMDGKGVDMAIRAFRDPDKHYSRPGRGPEWLWELFKERYLATSHDILCHHRDRFPDGPEKFITGVNNCKRR